MLAVCLDGQHFFVWARVSTCEFGNLARYYLAPSATLVLSPLIGTAVAACLLRIVVIYSYNLYVVRSTWNSVRRFSW